jgi:DNA/RNA endonuclease YhcR with UshA esterase domain
VVLVLVDRLDLAVVRALRYAGSLRPTELRAMHLVLDSQVSDELSYEWISHGLGDRVPLELVECPDRRLVRTVSQQALRAVIREQAEVTVLLPRRTYRRTSQRILHDRTADRIAGAVGRIPHVSATIVPFDTTLSAEVESWLQLRQEQAARQPALEPAEPATPVAAQPVAGTSPIGSVACKQRVTVQGQVKIVQVGTTAGKSLEVQVYDDTGGIRLLFFGRTHIPGIAPGAILRATGRVGEYKGHLALANPRYELVPER